MNKSETDKGLVGASEREREREYECNPTTVIHRNPRVPNLPKTLNLSDPVSLPIDVNRIIEILRGNLENEILPGKC